MGVQMSDTLDVRRPADGRWRRMRAPLGTIAGLSAATLALHLRDPHSRGSWGFCPSSLLLGIDCPGCGGLRAVNDLTNLRFADAASSNLVVFLGIPVAIVGLLVWTWRRWHDDRRPLMSTWTYNRLTVATMSFLILFMIVRNTPWGAWLHS